MTSSYRDAVAAAARRFAPAVTFGALYLCVGLLTRLVLWARFGPAADVPVARRVATEVVSLPVHPRLARMLVQADELIHASLVDEAIVVVTNTVTGTSNYRTLDELQARLDNARHVEQRPRPPHAAA